jgi:hypothetical protein
MVDAITPVSASSETTATHVEKSLSITSEPDNKWVASRQSKIDADQVESRRRHPSSAETSPPVPEDVEEELPPLFEGHARKRRSRQEPGQDLSEETDAHLLSGESTDIGSTNFDDETPFGDRVAIV